MFGKSNRTAEKSLRDENGRILNIREDLVRAFAGEWKKYSELTRRMRSFVLLRRERWRHGWREEEII